MILDTGSRPTGRTIPGGRYAFQTVHPGSPMLRIRYRDGVPVGPYGFPHWLPYARAVVRVAPSTPDLGVDEERLVDLLAANHTLAESGDPLWTGLPDGATPAGWTWAHLAEPLDGPRRLALVPIELHAAHRHLGGVSTGRADRTRRGLPGASGPPAPPPIRVSARLTDEAVARIEDHLGYGLPAGYRAFLAGTNGGCPSRAAVHPGFGFLVDQPLFGVARQDWLQDLVYANGYLTDRLTPDLLAVGYVQGGLIAVRVHGDDAGSVHYLDDDDHRGTDDDRPEDIRDRLLRHCGTDFVAFWLALTSPPEELWELARQGHATIVHPPGMGSSLRRPGEGR